jgi:hypothetical protein
VTYYVHPQQKWDAKLCKRIAARKLKDAFGTPHPYRGYVYGANPYPVCYNGGCIRGDTWYNGEVRPLARLARGYEWKHIPTWGYHVVKVK